MNIINVQEVPNSGALNRYIHIMFDSFLGAIICVYKFILHINNNNKCQSEYGAAAILGTTHRK